MNTMSEDSLYAPGIKTKKITEDFYIDTTNQIGNGVYGKVYRGFQFSTHQIIAVKFICKAKLVKNPNYEREIIVMQDLANIRHHHVMGYYGYTQNQDGLYFFLEFCSGGNLDKLIKKGISEIKALSLFQQLLDAMAFISSKNIVHRDLKPENIMLDENGDLKIADFGLSRDVEPQMTKGICTPLYGAPEVVQLNPYNEKCDVWSAGLILFQMLTGRPFFQNVINETDLIKRMKKMKNEKQSPQLPKQLNPEWQKIISKMICIDPQKRSSFKQLHEQLTKLYPQIRSALHEKYFKDLQMQELQNDIRLTSTIRPYKKTEKKINSLFDVVFLLKQQKSYTYINNSLKWINFSKQKMEILMMLIKQFNICEYQKIKNVYKYIFMFLSVSYYIANIQQLISQIQNKKIVTPKGQIYFLQLILQSHLEQFMKVLKEKNQKMKMLVRKYRKIVEQQILVRIIGIYMKRNQEKKVIKDCQGLENLVILAKNGEYIESKKYMQIFRKIANMNAVYCPTELLQQFNQPNLRMYTYIRIIANLDQVFIDSFFQNGDYIKSKKQMIDKANKKQLLEMLLVLNKV